ncbi:MAG: hypothetical protein ACOCP8_05465 [archaeon]
MSYDFVGLIIEWFFNESGGEYLERPINSDPFKMDKETAKKCVKHFNLNKYFEYNTEELAEKIKGLKVWATR